MQGRSEAVRLQDILAAIDGVNTALDGATFERFVESWVLQRVTERAVEIISEASRHVSQEHKDATPDVPWRAIANIGNVLRHEYQRVEPLILWNVVRVHLPILRIVVARLIGASSSSTGSA